MMAKKRKTRTNKQILQDIQALENLGNEQYFCYVMDNDVFHIRVMGAYKDISPGEKRPNLTDYQQMVTIQLYDHKEVSETLGYTGTTITIGENTFGIRYHMFPYTSINVPYDPRFKEQKWTKKFLHCTNWATSSLNGASVTLRELCSILRYCEKISHLKAFW